MGRMRGVVERPEGLVYQPALLVESQDVALQAELERLELREVRIRGQVAKRTVYHYGYDYGYESWPLTSGEPIPAWMQDVRARCAALAGVEASALTQVLVTKYPPGASIGWQSADVLAGAARRLWQHSIPPVPRLRYSLTFRTLRRGGLGTRPA